MSTIRFSDFCFACKCIRWFLYVRDRGNSEIYHCEKCGAEKNIVVR